MQTPDYHSLGPYKFCPLCADALVVSNREDLPRRHCPSCDRMFYQNPAPAAGGIIQSGDSVLLVRRKFAPRAGEWTLPAGFMEYHESAEACAKREILEETGLEVNVGQLFGVYAADDDPRHTAVLILYSMQATGGSLAPGDDALEAEYFGPDSIPEQIAFGAHKQALVDLYGPQIGARWAELLRPNSRTIARGRHSGGTQ